MRNLLIRIIMFNYFFEYDYEKVFFLLRRKILGKFYSGEVGFIERVCGLSGYKSFSRLNKGEIYCWVY